MLSHSVPNRSVVHISPKTDLGFSKACVHNLELDLSPAKGRESRGSPR